MFAFLLLTLYTLIAASLTLLSKRIAVNDFYIKYSFAIFQYFCFYIFYDKKENNLIDGVTAHVVLLCS